MSYDWEKEQVHNLAEHVGFYGLVGLIRLILSKHYPSDLFAGSPDKGARFTQKLHEALAILDDPKIDADEYAAVSEPEKDELFDELADQLPRNISTKGMVLTPRYLQEKYGISYARAADLREALLEAGVLKKDAATGRYKVI
ncbi:hypothetical protein [Bradyrhizobium sp. AUGA SZCCT0431]|uniref:hypothetical protein n=1 Tax=Bradyrhizobium sp. AUGA SZCCT0431 TaxID=2807674 RepID=UPI001BA8EA69|nr:hypothetical protein [Bradyrhizobium sp. AUGA SZCCT0431]MBR1146650.1 hypothetical protein [Bradyrhizobium sp. AUGA SZCCT0431]